VSPPEKRRPPGKDRGAPWQNDGTDAAKCTTGVYFVHYRHDLACPTLATQRAGDCTCLEVEVAQVDQDEFVNGIRRTRAMRRRAEREAKKVLKRAQRRGGA